MRHLIAIVVVLAIGTAFAQRPGPPPARSPQDGPARVLRWVVESAAKQRFAGQRKLGLIVEGQPVQLVEFVWRDGLKTRIEYPEDSLRRGFIVVERMGERLEFDPRKNEIRRRKGDPSGPDFVLGRIRDAFARGEIRVVEFDAADVAGRKSMGLAVADARGNVAQRFWIDREKGIVLAAVQYGRSGERRGYFEYTRINFNPSFPEGAFNIVRQGARIVDDAEGHDVPWRVVLPTWLPPGFKETSRAMREAGAKSVLTIHFSDGRSHMTLFQAPGTREGVLPPREVAAGKVLMSGQVGNIWVALLSDLDAKTVDAVMKSLRASD